MKKFFKFGCLGIIGLIILGIIIGALSGEDEDATTTPKEETKSEKKEEPKEKEKKEEESFKIGDVVKVGDMEYTISKKTIADQVGPSILPEKASEKFIVLDVEIKNNGNEAVMIDASFFILKRGEKTYESDSMASISANQGENGQIENSFFAQDLNPDSKATGKIVFDIASEVAESSDLQLQVQTGLFGTETELINLK